MTCYDISIISLGGQAVLFISIIRDKSSWHASHWWVVDSPQLNIIIKQKTFKFLKKKRKQQQQQRSQVVTILTTSTPAQDNIAIGGMWGGGGGG